MAENTDNSVSATPDVPAKQTNFDTQVAASSGVKPATPDLILFNQDVLPVDAMADLIFEDIGGHELINMMRHDTVKGQNVNYSLVSNSKAVSKSYSPSNIVFAPGSLVEFFKNFAIRLDIHTPETQSVNDSDNVYLDDTGSLVVEVTKMEINEQVEIQVLNSGSYLSDII